jgi:hypothetical protein
MMKFEGGYFVKAASAEAVQDMHEAFVEFLADEFEDPDTGEPVDPKGWVLLVRARQGSPLMYVEPILPDDLEREMGVYLFIQEEPALPALISGKLDCDLGAFAYHSQTNSEFAELFEAGHSTETWLTDRDDDTDDDEDHDDDEEEDDEADDDVEDSRDTRPLTLLAHRFGVSRDFLLDLMNTGKSIEVPMDQPYPTERVQAHFAALPSMQQHLAPGKKANLQVTLPQSLVEEATALAAQQDTSLGDIFSQAFKSMSPQLRERVRQDATALSQLVKPQENEPRVTCSLDLGPRLKSELDDLVEFSDMPRAWLLGVAFRLSQSR